MKPVKDYDYEQTDKLSVILSDKRLMSKYHKKYGKYITIKCTDSFFRKYFWKVERAFLELLLQKYGDIGFRTAVDKWEHEER